MSCTCLPDRESLVREAELCFSTYSSYAERFRRITDIVRNPEREATRLGFMFAIIVAVTIKWQFGVGWLFTFIALFGLSFVGYILVLRWMAGNVLPTEGKVLPESKVPLNWKRSDFDPVACDRHARSWKASDTVRLTKERLLKKQS